MTGAPVLASHPARLARLVVVGASPEPPGWARDWLGRDGRRPDVSCIPAPPGRRPTTTDLVDAVAPHTARPVLVVPPDAAGTNPRHVTAAVHELPDDVPVLLAAGVAAERWDVPVTVTHALPLSFAGRSVGLESALEHGRRTLDAAAGRLVADNPGLTVVTRLFRAHPHELVGEELDTGLLVMGGPRRHPQDELGLVALTALHHAPCPVLLVPR